MAGRRAHDPTAEPNTDVGAQGKRQPTAQAAERDAPDDMPRAAAAPTLANPPTPASASALPVPQTARGEATRRRILDAAEAVFGAVGYYEASISEITRRAGVAQGTFYIYFHTKRDAFVELIEDIGNRLRAATRAAIAGAPTRIEAERRGFAAFLRFVAEHRQIYRIVEEAGRVAPDAAREYYRRISVGYERGLRSAMARGEVRVSDAEALATALMGIGHFVALRWLIWPAASAATTGEIDAPGESGEVGEAGAPGVPDAIFAALLDFIAHGLGTPD